MTIEIKAFNDLSLDEFHDLIALRIAVFVIEQDCPYQDLDGKDKSSYHLILRNDDDKIIGTARILPAGLSYPEIAIGRVVTSIESRELKLGHKIMEHALEFIQQKWENKSVKLSAQSHLTGYYGKHGFVSTGKEYLEDGIPHTEMKLTK
jgi:ElaA protein|tara:strand:+ start:3689 stop:4135 length:447 start_codon:yes stop_codon:yes gene_type:complete